MVDSGGEFFQGRVKYPESDASSSKSSRQMMAENKGDLMVDDMLFVAVGKVVRESKKTLIWALHKQKSERKKKVCLIHVHQPVQFIPMPMGGKFPASQVGQKELKAFREQETQEMLRVLDDYLQICKEYGVNAEKVHVEADSIEEGIVGLISRHRIERLVMGAAANSRCSRKMIEPKSKKANYVRQHAPDFCHIWFICKGLLVHTREAVTTPSSVLAERLSHSLENNQSDPTVLSQELNSKLRLSDAGGYEGSSDEFERLSTASCSLSSLHSLETESVFTSPRSSFASGEVPITGLELVALPQTQTKLHLSSPPSVLENSSIDDLYDQLEQAMTEAENLRREAFEESMRRRNAEKQAGDAIRKAKAAERLYCQEVRQRKETEEELVKRKKELQNAKKLRDKVAQELKEAFDQKESLESQIEKSDLAQRELKEKIVSAVGLLEKYKEERDALEKDRDNALQEASDLRKQLGEGPSSSNTVVYFSEFSFFDLEQATNHFDPSLKIGEGGYGGIYKGLLRHTEVAIKILDPTSRQGPEEFQQEVDVLSKLRHPNLVTLIGACPDAWALVYEFLPGGSLEDRLSCKDNSPPLQWHTRIRIATELCSVLIFLHSSWPSSIVHGDLKPANILLDDNLVSKLSDFGICRVLSSNENSMGEAPSFSPTEPKGTFSYMDPEVLTTGELTVMSDVYSFGVILLRLLTGRPAMGIVMEVQYALDKGNLNNILDTSAGDWPFVQAEQLARMALRCCDKESRNRPDLTTHVWRVLEPMTGSTGGLTALQVAGEGVVPRHFVCPIFQEIMQDPHIAADGFTYEAEAIKGWFDSGHDTSPMTNEELTNHNLIPNLALRSAIQEWLQHQ